MPKLTYTIKYKKNEGLVISPEELTSLYFYGISTKSRDGSDISNDTMKMYILSAQQEIEKFLEIRFNKKLIEETQNYYKDDYWGGFPILRPKLPVAKPLSFIGFLNNIEQIKYPLDWLNVKKDSEGHYYKKIHLIPTGSTTSRANSDIILTGITAYLGLTSYSQVPNYFSIQYITGYNYEDVPLDLINVVGKMAAIGLFGMLGDIILGSPGIMGLSLGMDGLSQNISTTMSSGNSGYSARIKQYSGEIKVTLDRLRLFYKSFNISVV
jgi:hypothetical protein